MDVYRFTNREIITLCLSALALLLVLLFSNYLSPALEYVYLLVVVAPLGYLIATDPERKN